MPIVSQYVSVKVSDFQAFLLSGINRFRNVEYSHSAITRRHNLKPNDANAKKQARQLSQALVLAIRYLESAKSAGPEIRPVLLYYAIMNFAVSEVLMKQDGMSSLDKARGQHAHHGLEISFASGLNKMKHFSDLTRGIAAKPHEISHIRRGTFELWHRTAREHPVLGKVHYPNDSHGMDMILAAEDRRLPLVDSSRLTLEDCVSLIPSLSTTITRFGITSKYARGYADVKFETNTQSRLKFVVHPDAKDVIQGVADRILFSSAACEDVQFKSYDSGFAFAIPQEPGSIRNFKLPLITSISHDDLRICSTDSPLNEFGAFYAAFFLLGNLCRYYPDVWIPELETHSDLAILTQILCEEAFIRLPHLVLGELEGTLYLPN